MLTSLFIYTLNSTPDYDWPTYLFRYRSAAFPLTIIPQAGGRFSPSLSSRSFSLLRSPLSSLLLLDVQSVMQSLQLLWWGCGCENGGLHLQDSRKAKASDDEQEEEHKKQNRTQPIWDSRRRRKQQDWKERCNKTHWKPVLKINVRKLNE